MTPTEKLKAVTAETKILWEAARNLMDTLQEVLNAETRLSYESREKITNARVTIASSYPQAALRMYDEVRHGNSAKQAQYQRIKRAKMRAKVIEAQLDEKLRKYPENFRLAWKACGGKDAGLILFGVDIVMRWESGDKLEDLAVEYNQKALLEEVNARLKSNREDVAAQKAAKDLDEYAAKEDAEQEKLANARFF